MSNLRAFTQTSLEKKRYTVSYRRWMDEDEVLFSHAIVVSPSTDPSLLASDAFTSNGDTEVSFFLSGGTSGSLYTVKLLATTDQGQIKEDNIQLYVGSQP